MDAPHTHECPACQHLHVCYGVGCDERDAICDECADDFVTDEPDHNDTVHCCPDCERPNQFGELCPSCQREADVEYDMSMHWEASR